MRLDSVVMHADDIGVVIGKFYDSDIREVSLLSVEVRDEIDAQANARYSLGTTPASIELIHDEVIQDGLIRRFTTSEVVGETFYDEAIPAGRQVPLEAFTEGIPKGTMLTWRPNGQPFIVIHEEVAE